MIFAKLSDELYIAAYDLDVIVTFANEANVNFNDIKRLKESEVPKEYSASISAIKEEGLVSEPGCAMRLMKNYQRYTNI